MSSLSKASAATSFSACRWAEGDNILSTKVTIFKYPRFEMICCFPILLNVVLTFKEQKPSGAHYQHTPICDHTEYLFLNIGDYWRNNNSCGYKIKKKIVCKCIVENALKWRTVTTVTKTSLHTGSVRCSFLEMTSAGLWDGNGFSHCSDLSLFHSSTV